jgi:hypothetical protein
MAADHEIALPVVVLAGPAIKNLGAGAIGIGRRAALPLNGFIHIRR